MIGDQKPADLTPERLAPFDQFHTGGLAATVAVGGLLGLDPGSTLLDLGSGLGGPARYFARECKLNVHGVDFSQPFVAAARAITEHIGLDDVVFSVGDVRVLPFEAESFDGAVMLHVAMNIEERVDLYREIARILKNGAPFVTYDVVRATGEPDYPTPWAAKREFSFLQSAEKTIKLLELAGLTVNYAESKSREAAALLGPAGIRSSPLAALLGLDEFDMRVANLRKSLETGTTAILTARAVRSA